MEKSISPETVAFRLERELLEHRKKDEEAVWVEVNQAVADILLGEKESYRPILEEAIAKKLFFNDYKTMILISMKLNGWKLSGNA